MSDLVAFLTARLDEEEHLARGGDQRSPDLTLRLDDDLYWVSVTPARILADVKAKRRILARHQGEPYPNPGDELMDLGCTPFGGKPRCPDECAELRDMASVYAWRPGYRQEWAPNE